MFEKSRGHRLGRLRPRSVYDVMAAIACLGVLTGGTAYASHLVVNGSDVVDESLTGSDVRGTAGTADTPAVNGSLTFKDISGQPANAANGSPFIDGTLTQWDIKNNSLTGSDVANGSISGSDIADNSLTNLDMLNDIITNREIVDGSLNDEDIGQGTFVDFTAFIGDVPANECADSRVTGVNAQGDHALLTTNWNTAQSELSYSVLYSSNTDSPSQGESVRIRACNPTAVTQEDENTDFNLLVFDAQ